MRIDFNLPFRRFWYSKTSLSTRCAFSVLFVIMACVRPMTTKHIRLRFGEILKATFESQRLLPFFFWKKKTHTTDCVRLFLVCTTAHGEEWGNLFRNVWNGAVRYFAYECAIDATSAYGAVNSASEQAEQRNGTLKNACLFKRAHLRTPLWIVEYISISAGHNRTPKCSVDKSQGAKKAFGSWSSVEDRLIQIWDSHGMSETYGTEPYNCRPMRKYPMSVIPFSWKHVVSTYAVNYKPFAINLSYSDLGARNSGQSVWLFFFRRLFFLLFLSTTFLISRAPIKYLCVYAFIWSLNWGKWWLFNGVQY